MYIIKYLDGLEYAMLTHKKYYKHKNIEKFHKKKYIVKKIPSIIEKELKIIKNSINKNKIILKEKLKHNIKCILILYEIIKLKPKHIEINFDINCINHFKYIINIIIKKIIPIYLNKLIQKYENIITINIYKLYNIYIYNIELTENKNKNNYNIITKTLNIFYSYAKQVYSLYVIIKNKFINIYINYFKEDYTIESIKYINENYNKYYTHIYQPFM